MAGINDIAPSAISGKKGGKKKGRKGGKRRGGRRGTGFLANFNKSNGLKALALVAGAVAGEYVHRRWGATVAEKTGQKVPLGLAVAAGGLVLATQKFVPAGYRELAQVASLGAAVPVGVQYAQGLNVLPPAAGVGDVEGADDIGDVEGYEAEGLVSIGNIGDLDDVGASEEVKALRIAKRIAKAKAKGKDKRVSRLEGRAVKKGLDDELARYKSGPAPVRVRVPRDSDGDGIPNYAEGRRRRFRDADGDGVPNRFDPDFRPRFFRRRRAA